MTYGIEELLDLVIEVLESGELDKLPQSKPNPHGKCVDCRFEPYHTVFVYEDGHEDWISIGD